MKGNNRPVNFFLLTFLFYLVSHAEGGKAPKKSFYTKPRQVSPLAIPLVYNNRLAKRPGVNSLGAQNNCAYCTIAGVSKTTVGKLTNGPRAPMDMDSTFIRTPTDIQRLSQQSGFPNTKFKTAKTESGLRNILNKDLVPGQMKTYGLAYTHRQGGGGHVVAMNVKKPEQPNAPLRTQIIDFQQEGRKRFQTRPDASKFHLFDFGKKQN